MQHWIEKIPLNALQIFQLLRFGTTLLIGIFLAKKSGLSTADIALYEILLFLGNLVSFFWISAGVKTLLSEFPNRPKDGNRFVINLFWTLLGIGFLAAMPLLFFPDFVTQQFTNYEQLGLLPYVGVIVLLNTPAALIEFLYLLRKEPNKLVNYGLVLFTGQLLAVTVTVYFFGSIAVVFKALLGLHLLKFGWLLWLLKTQFGKKLPFFTLDVLLQKRIFYLLIPLALHMLIGGGMEYVDGLIVSNQFNNPATFAIFRYGARELPLVTILMAALSATLIPLAVTNPALAVENIKKEVNKMVNWLYPLAILLTLLSPYLFPMVYNQAFAASAEIFNIYLLIISSRILLPQVIILAKQHNYVLVGSALLEVILNLGLSLYWVELFGLRGIAFATVVAYLLNKLILMTYNYFAFAIPFSAYINWTKYFGFNLGLFLAFMVSFH
ncbi:MAG: hypothetical protein AAF960_28440 [Bacteroidota bacterium]